MKDVMSKGDLKGKIATDSLNSKETYGLGPIEFLKGEIVVFEGQSYVSKVVDSILHKVSKVPSVSAPFFVYSSNSDLKIVKFNRENYTLKELEEYVNLVYKDYDQPLLIRIDGVFEDIKLHSVNLPEGKKVSSPDEAHQGQTNYVITNEEAEIIGFFSKEHQGIFTHHDSFLHMHLITQDESKMGHLDELQIDEMKLYLPRK